MQDEAAAGSHCDGVFHTAADVASAPARDYDLHCAAAQVYAEICSASHIINLTAFDTKSRAVERLIFLIALIARLIILIAR